MSIIIKPIDQLAREKKRNVLYMGFPEVSGRGVLFRPHSPQRDIAIAWLEARQIAYDPCGLEASEDVMAPYLGHLYIDLPYDSDHPLCDELFDRFEHSVGLTKEPSYSLYFFELDAALKNAHHDEPGFWENLADTV